MGLLEHGRHPRATAETSVISHLTRAWKKRRTAAFRRNTLDGDDAGSAEDLPAWGESLMRVAGLIEDTSLKYRCGDEHGRERWTETTRTRKTSAERHKRKARSPISQHDLKTQPSDTRPTGRKKQEPRAVSFCNQH
jgi:hypothetical protein